MDLSSRIYEALSQEGSSLTSEQVRFVLEVLEDQGLLYQNPESVEYE